MDIKINALRFNITEKLQDFIEKKLSKLEKKEENISKIEVTLKVVKPETASNKEVAVHVSLPGGELRAEKVCDTFEEAVDLCADVLKRQIEKHKDKQRGK